MAPENNISFTTTTTTVRQGVTTCPTCTNVHWYQHGAVSWLLDCCKLITTINQCCNQSSIICARIVGVFWQNYIYIITVYLKCKWCSWIYVYDALPLWLWFQFDDDSSLLMIPVWWWWFQLSKYNLCVSSVLKIVQGGQIQIEEVCCDLSVHRSLIAASPTMVLVPIYWCISLYFGAYPYIYMVHISLNILAHDAVHRYAARWPHSCLFNWKLPDLRRDNTTRHETKRHDVGSRWQHRYLWRDIIIVDIINVDIIYFVVLK